MAIYHFSAEQKIPAPIDTIWAFISSPENLQRITPDYLQFSITSQDLPTDIYPGLIISYNVRPLLNIKMTWVSEITHVKEKESFIDEQRAGPYAMWHHEHHITPITGGTLMKDAVTYKPPFGILGAVANTLFIRKNLKQIFEYRKQVLIDIFGKYE